jgi:hypothetical protein
VIQIPRLNRPNLKPRIIPKFSELSEDKQLALTKIYEFAELNNFHITSLVKEELVRVISSKENWKDWIEEVRKRIVGFSGVKVGGQNST